MNNRNDSLTNEKVNSSKTERPILAFWNKHKKEIAIVSGIVGGIGALILCVLGLKHHWNAASFDRWLKKAPLDDLKKARDNVQSEYLKHNTNDQYRENLIKVRSLLDKKISNIESAGHVSSPPTYPREHGHGLYKPD